MLANDLMMSHRAYIDGTFQVATLASVIMIRLIVGADETW